MDLQEAFDQGFEAVKSYVDRSFAAYECRLSDLEKHLSSLPTPRDGADGKDGKDADPVAIVATVKDTLSAEFVNTVAEIQRANAEAIARLEAALEDQKQAHSVTASELQEARNVLAELKEEFGDLDEASKYYLGQIEELRHSMNENVNEAVKSAVDAIPKPKDGRDGVDGKDGAPGEKGEKGDPGKDGLDVKDLFRAEGGILVATMSDGRVKELGRFVGEKGEPGKDGADGFGFDDLTVEYDGEKNFAFKFIKGERVKQFDFTLPVVLDRGIFTSGKEYTPGDGVTWAGHYWIAQAETKAKPGEGNDWRLAVKRGRDGKTFTVKVGEQKSPVSLTKDEDNG